MSCEDLAKIVQEKTVGLSDKFKISMKSLTDELQERAKAINPDIDTSGIDVWVGLDIDIKWDTTNFSLDLPDVKMVDQKVILDLPQVTMKTQEIIFHTPSVRMETKKVGEYPEFYCDTSSFIPKCTVRWSPIYADVPVPFMQEQKISLDLPEFKMDTTSFVMGIPEFSMRRQEFSLSLPQITVKNISAEANAAKEAGERLKEDGKRRTTEAIHAFRENNKVEIGVDITAMFDCYRDLLTKNRTAALAQIEGSITGTQNAVNALSTAGAQGDDPALAGFQSNLANMRKAREDLIIKFDASLASLDQAQKDAVQKLMSELPGDQEKAA